MSRNDELWERAMRVLDYEIPANEYEAIAVLKRWLGLGREQALEFYNEWLIMEP